MIVVVLDEQDDKDNKSIVVIVKRMYPDTTKLTLTSLFEFSRMYQHLVTRSRTRGVGCPVDKRH